MSTSKKLTRQNRASVFFTLLAFTMVSSPYIGFGQTTGNALESQVKAAYIYNFTKFIYWDAHKRDTSTNPISIAVLGAGSIGDILEDFSKKQTEARPLVVKKLKKEKIDVTGCHMIFIGRLEHQQLPALLKKLEGTDILTVSDIPGFARQGGMIGFFIEDGKVKIEINMDAVNNAKLKISAKLLEVAKITSREN